MSKKGKSLYYQLRELYPNGHPDFIPMCLKEIELHSKKNADYAHDGDPLGNFYRVSDALTQWGIKCPPSIVAFIYMMKQVDAVGQMLGREYEGQVEGVDDKLQDISVYAKLVRILHREETIEERSWDITTDNTDEDTRTYGMPPFSSGLPPK